MRKIIIVSGLPNSGRDTFISWIQENIPNIRKISYKSIINDMLKQIGWNRIEDKKYYTLRNKVLSALEIYNNGLAPVISAMIMLRDSPNFVFIIKCNQPKDINRIKKRFPKKKIVTILISRKGCRSNSIPKDQILNYPYDIVFTNDDTIESLQKKAEEFALQHITIFTRINKEIIPVKPN